MLTTIEPTPVTNELAARCHALLTLVSELTDAVMEVSNRDDSLERRLLANERVNASNAKLRAMLVDGGAL